MAPASRFADLWLLCCAVAPTLPPLQFPKSDYAGELPLLCSLTRQEVVTNLRDISHIYPKYVPQFEGVYPHQALPGMFEARLYDVPPPGRPKGPYQVRRRWCWPLTLCVMQT